MLGTQSSVRAFLLQGVAGGIAGGLAFAAVEILLSALAGASPFTPLRTIGSMPLGQQALGDDYPLLTAAGVGLAVHFTLSAIYGVIFAGIVWAAGQADKLTSMAIAVGVFYAMALWIVNFLVIGPVMFDQLRVESLFWFGFSIAHFFYGAVLGAYLVFATQRHAVRNGAAGP